MRLAGLDEGLTVNMKKKKTMFCPHSLFPEGPSWHFHESPTRSQIKRILHLKSMLFQQMEIKKKHTLRAPTGNWIATH